MIESAGKTIVTYNRTDRANEVNKGFIIWLYCSEFGEKTRKHFFVAVFVVVLFGVIHSP